MPSHWPLRGQPRQLPRMMLLITLALSVVACTGPETGDDRDPTPTPTATATPTEVPPTATATLTPTAEPTATTTPTATVGVSPTAASSATAATTATVAQVSLPDRLPTLEDLPNERYAIAEEGTRSAEDLAAAYSDVVAHLRRLDEWGFKQHVFRAFSLTGADDDTLPHLILTTINAYGSAEQAEAALQWLQQYGTATGATESDPPSVGEQAVALTVPTSTGIPTASIYVRQGSLLFVYFAEGGDPLPIVDSIATKVFSR